MTDTFKRWFVLFNFIRAISVSFSMMKDICILPGRFYSANEQM